MCTAPPPPPPRIADVEVMIEILRDLGVGQIRLMGAPLKYNALAGFGLEVIDFLSPETPID